MTRGLRLVLAIGLALFLLQACQPASGKSAQDVVARQGAATDSLSQQRLSDFPPEARETLRDIRQGGPFAYARDGVVFGNFERILPNRPRGYYHEYTVKTPGAHNRGVRRIISGAPGEYYYTDDHYQSFKRIRE